MELATSLTIKLIYHNVISMSNQSIKKWDWRYVGGAFLTPFVALGIGYWLYVPYQKIAGVYYIFLRNVGYYEYVFRPNCNHRGCYLNLINDVPLAMVTLVPIGLFYFFIFRKLSAEKKRSIFWGVIISFFSIIFLFLVVPLLSVLV